MNNIIQWNCRGLRANFTDFILLCDKYNPIIVCYQQETRFRKDDFVSRGLKIVFILLVHDICLQVRI